MGRGRWLRALAPAACVAVGVLSAAGCGARTICDYPASAGTIVGPLRAVHGAVATFDVDRVEREGDEHPPTGGRPVDVHYSAGEQRFLHVGRSYRVTLWFAGGVYVSGVHHADDACSTGTEYATGKSIDTSLWSRSFVRRAIYVAIALLISALVLLAWLTMR